MRGKKIKEVTKKKKKWNPLCFGFIGCVVGISVQFWAPQYKNGVKVLKKSQRKATQMVKGLEGISCEERVRTLDCPRLEKRRLRSDFVAPYSTLRSGAEGGASLCSLELMAKCVRTCQGRVWQGIRKHFFTVTVDRHWNRLSGEVIDAPHLSMLKSHLYNALFNRLFVSPKQVRQVDSMIFVGPFKLNYSILWIR